MNRISRCSYLAGRLGSYLVSAAALSLSAAGACCKKSPEIPCEPTDEWLGGAIFWMKKLVGCAGVASPQKLPVLPQLRLAVHIKA